MVFSSFTFLCFFLPAVFLLYRLIRSTRARNLLLAAASLIFYAYGEPVYVLLLLFMVTLNYFFGLKIGENRSKPVLAAAVVMNLGVLVLFKYSGLTALPIGISFYTFQTLSYLIDVYRGEVEAQKNYVALLLYVSFFPQLIAGPIVKYHDINQQIEEREEDTEEIKRGLYRFSIGLGKKILIANSCAAAADKLYSLDPRGLGAMAAWIAALAYYFQIFFDFSGYSDMAIGLGKLFGFRFKENFNYPYAAVSVQDFWRRWHISLSTWFREYLYIPLGGNRRGSGRTFLNLYLVFLATGTWHGANWTFPVWGLYHGTFLVLERIGIIPVNRGKAKLPGLVYANLVALFGWVIFRADSLRQAGLVIAAMLGFGGNGAVSRAAAQEFLSPYYLVLCLLACLFSAPFAKNAWTDLGIRCKENRRAALLFELLCMAGSLLLIILCFLQLASDSYNPFIYFRF